MNGKKIFTVLVTFASVVLLGVAGTSLIGDEQQGPRRPGSKFSIPKEELDAVLASADNGNLPAIRRLIYYFEQYEGDFEKAKYWSKRARAHGDENELKLYAFELLTHAQNYAKDAEQKSKILAEALVIAERVVASNRTAENERFVQQIKAEQSRGKN
ncbi:hypothetical protein [Pseudoduganella namucuonensis]|uniref:hypothetical protein n=1 Tax=Pseudoduganella namucuonensis TaxID=1035707 RepID=UPI000B81CD25|nr:hypothetical protein [Pseudoduganella namucuonensis]